MDRFLLVLALGRPLFAQPSSLTGVIRGSQNGVVAGAVIALTNVDTSTPRKTLSSSTGDYVFSQIPPGKLMVEVVQQDFFQALTEFKDQKTNTTWAQAAGVLRDRFESGLTPAVPILENMFPGAANRTFPGSDLDALNDMDR